jgi:hypothetical protein
MVDRIDRTEFEGLFTGFSESAFRLETLPAYLEPVERDALERFIAGRAPDDSWIQGYLQMVRAATDRGRRFERVRVLQRPPTDYQRFVMDLAARCNIPAGEQVRVLDVDEARQQGLPMGCDFWLFDDARVAVMHFDAGALQGAELVTDPEPVERFVQLRRVAWQAARPAGVAT